MHPCRTLVSTVVRIPLWLQAILFLNRGIGTWSVFGGCGRTLAAIKYMHDKLILTNTLFRVKQQRVAYKSYGREVWRDFSRGTDYKEVCSEQVFNQTPQYNLSKALICVPVTNEFKQWHIFTLHVCYSGIQLTLYINCTIAISCVTVFSEFSHIRKKENNDYNSRVKKW